jgi:hypothetical protein
MGWVIEHVFFHSWYLLLDLDVGHFCLVQKGAVGLLLVCMHVFGFRGRGVIGTGPVHGL